MFHQRPLYCAIRLFGNPALTPGEPHEVEQARFDEDTGSRLQPFTGLYMRCHGQKFGSTWDAIAGTIPDDDVRGKRGEKEKRRGEKQPTVIK